MIRFQHGLEASHIHFVPEEASEIVLIRGRLKQAQADKASKFHQATAQTCYLLEALLLENVHGQG